MDAVVELFTKPSFVFDIICLAVVLVMASRYAGKGFLAAAAESGGTLLSIFGARTVSGWASDRIFELFMADDLQKRVAENLASGSRIDLQALADRYAGFLPESFRRSAAEAFEKTLAASLEENAERLAEQVVDGLLRPLLTPMLCIVLFFAVLAVLRFLMGMLTKVMGAANKLPVIGLVNRLLGYALGLCVGILYLFIGLCAVWAAIAFTGGSLPVLNDAELSTSVFYHLFETVNPFIR